MRDDIPADGYQPHPLAGDEDEDEEHEPVQEPQRVDPEVPPAREPDRMPTSWQPDTVRQGERVHLRGVERIRGNRLLHPEPVLARGRVPGQVQARVVGEDRHARADDEDHEEGVEEMLPAEPGREPDGGTCREFRLSRVLSNEFLDAGELPQTLRDGDACHEKDEPDRDQPEQVEPSVTADTDARGDTVLGRHSACPVLVHHIVRLFDQFRPIARMDSAGRVALVWCRKQLVVGRRVDHVFQRSPRVVDRPRRGP